MLAAGNSQATSVQRETWQRVAVLVLLLLQQHLVINHEFSTPNVHSVGGLGPAISAYSRTIPQLGKMCPAVQERSLPTNFNNFHYVSTGIEVNSYNHQGNSCISYTTSLASMSSNQKLA
jgi:hypothetical protein